MVTSPPTLEYGMASTSEAVDGGLGLEIEIERPQIGVAVEQSHSFRPQFGCGEDVVRRRKNRLQGGGGAVADVVVCHQLVVGNTTEGMVTPTVMGCAAPTSWAVIGVKDREAQLSLHHQDE